MDRKTDKLVSAIGDIDTAYLEEVLDLTAQMQAGENAPAFPNYLPRVRRC